MTNEKMTITKALSELKVLDNRISSEIHSAVFCNVSKHTMRTLGGKKFPTLKQKCRATTIR